MKFIDAIDISVAAGKGGDGMVSFRRAHNKPKMGADGGDGGDGGSVFLVGDPGINTLSRLRYKHKYRAEDGAKGGSNSCTGAMGEDLDIAVPFGTQVFVEGRMKAEVLPGIGRVLVAKGGLRGLGNERFLRPTHQAPEDSTRGKPGEEFDLNLQLKLLADVGLAGFPNAGKSTLLSVLSAAKPKIADYPFTTLEPNLGVVERHQGYEIDAFVMADIPGLIEGASLGKGLGLKFLKHLERTRLVVFLLDPTAEVSIERQLEILRQELTNYSRLLAEKPSLVVVSKSDAGVYDGELLSFSSATRQNLELLRNTIFEQLKV